jgi:hypothetical protein
MLPQKSPPAWIFGSICFLEILAKRLKVLGSQASLKDLSGQGADWFVYAESALAYLTTRAPRPSIEIRRAFVAP